MVEFYRRVCYNKYTLQGSYIGYYSGFPSLGGGFDSRTLLQKSPRSTRIWEIFYVILLNSVF